MRYLRSILNTTNKITLALILSLAISSCSMMHEDMDGCKKDLGVRFCYDMNMDFIDISTHQ